MNPGARASRVGYVDTNKKQNRCLHASLATLEIIHNTCISSSFHLYSGKYTDVNLELIELTIQLHFNNINSSSTIHRPKIWNDNNFAKISHGAPDYTVGTNTSSQQSLFTFLSIYVSCDDTITAKYTEMCKLQRAAGEKKGVNTWMTLVTCFTAQPTRVEINTKTMRGL
jgi:hypothetical protein